MEMKNLTWGQIQTSDTFGVRVSCRRSKTGNPIYLSISDQALELCGERQGVNDQVFEGLNDRDRYYHFQLWLAKAGIARRITFHDLRHTYGVLQIDAGTDIYTLQKQMGHGSAKQTQHYAKMSAKRQQQAANKIILKF